MEAGYRVRLANTTAIKKYEGLKYSGDAADAAYLAQLLRLDSLPEGYIHLARGARRARSRAQADAAGALPDAQILSIGNIMARQTGGRMSSNQIRRLSAEQINALGFAPDVTLAFKADLALGDRADA
jgi:hypothetical protein